jgi:hypothetical protein
VFLKINQDSIQKLKSKNNLLIVRPLPGGTLQPQLVVQPILLTEPQVLRWLFVDGKTYSGLNQKKLTRVEDKKYLLRITR